MMRSGPDLPVSSEARSIEAAAGLLDGKWKYVILYCLLEGTARFGELRRRVPSMAQRTLINQLRELEDDGLVDRKVYAEVPVKVEYSISSLGRTLEPVLSALISWGARLPASGTAVANTRPGHEPVLLARCQKGG